MFWTHLFWPKRYTRQTKQKLHWKSLIVIKGSKPHFFLLISIPQSKVTENYLFILFFKDASWSNLFSWLIAQVNFFTLVHSGQALSQARTALAVQGLRFHASFARGGHLTPGLETKIPHPSRGQEKNNSPRNKSFLIKKKKKSIILIRSCSISPIRSPKSPKIFSQPSFQQQWEKATFPIPMSHPTWSV